MDDNAVFAAIGDERRALADVLEGLTPAQWETQSLCGAWTVRDVGAHLVMALVTPIWKFGVAMIRAGGSFDAANVALTSRVATTQGESLPALLREHADSHFTPPGSGPLAPLTDILIHGQDIRRPLGITREFDPQRLRTVLDFLVSPASARGFRSGSRPAVRWEAPDISWASGSGPVVSGPGEAVMLVLTGRDVARTDLSGEGLSLL
jgi:uncharacterized protein (TIGR03083 family)